MRRPSPPGRRLIVRVKFGQPLAEERVDPPSLSLSLRPAHYANDQISNGHMMHIERALVFKGQTPTCYTTRGESLSDALSSFVYTTLGSVSHAALSPHSKAYSHRRSRSARAHPRRLWRCSFFRSEIQCTLSKYADLLSSKARLRTPHYRLWALRYSPWRYIARQRSTDNRIGDFVRQFAHRRSPGIVDERSSSQW